MIRLTDYETKTLLPKVIHDFRTKHSRFNPITSEKYCNRLQKEGFKIVDVSFRNIIKYIQIHGLLKHIVGAREGFFRTTSRPILMAQIESLKSREREIKYRRRQIEKQFKN